MIRYFDTSFLAPLFLVETTSRAIENFFSSIREDQLAISHWTRVEFASLIALKLRMRSLAPQAASVAQTRFETAAAESFTVFLPIVDDFDLAKEYLSHFATGLRGGDSLHLAIAANRRVEAIHSLDNGLLKAGAALGLPTSRGIRAAR